MDLSFGSLLAYAVFLVIGALIGVGLARRSKTANRYYDDVLERAVRAEEKLRELKAKK